MQTNPVKREKAGIRILIKLFDLIFTGVVLAIVASLLTTHILQKAEIKRLLEARLEDISNIYIGCNEDWIDERFGEPQFISRKDDFKMCAYVFEYCVIQIAYDNNNSTRAYLITSLKNDDKIQMKIKDSTFYKKGEFSLGSFSYYEIDEAPLSVSGYFTNGVGRICYREDYYYRAGGNYYTYCYATLDYGMNGNLQHAFIYNKDKPMDIDDEVTSNKIKGFLIVNDRHAEKPNSYGVTDNIEALNYLFDYQWFNSYQILNKARNFD